MIFEVGDVVGTASDKVVHRDHFIATREKVIAQVRADKARTASD